MSSLNYATTKDDEKTNVSSSKIRLDTIRSIMTIAAHLLIGIVVGVSVIYACRNGFSLGPTSQHIVLCVIGYQLLMGQAILCMAPNSWSSHLSLKTRRRVHWVLQVLGSTLALAGCIIKSIHKTSKGINYDTLHGQLGLTSMIFTAASLMNGVTSLYSYELRHLLPGSVSKLTHVCFGIVAYAAASICLVFGFDKNSFRSWVNPNQADAIIILTGALAVIVIVNPLISFYQKFSRVLKF